VIVGYANMIDDYGCSLNWRLNLSASFVF